MPYFEIKAFEAGIDLRKASLNAPAGTLRTLKNAVVGPGGEIEKSYSMRQFTLAPAATRDLLGDSLYVYTVVAAADGVAASPTPTSLGVITLPLPAGSHIKRVLDWDRYNNKFYIVVEAEPSLNALHFYDGVLVASVPSGTLARNVKTHKSKMYRIAGPAIAFSAVGAPADNTGTGSGSITIAAEDTDMQTLVALEVYYDKLAIMSQYATQLWTMDPDPSKNQFQQTLRQAGTIAPRSIKQYGSGDVLYVAGDGIRSLKAKDQSLAAAVSDIGSPIDSLIQNLVRTKGISNYMGLAVSLIEPYSGRFWVVLPDQILILSAFPTPRITAWSILVPRFVTEGKTIVGACVAGDRIAVRASDDWVYIYGNAAGIGFPLREGEEEPPQETRAFLTRDATVTPMSGTDIYTDQTVDLEFPFLAFEKPATFKTFTGVDVSCEGTWEIYAAFDPANPTAEEYLGIVTGPTFPARRFAMTGYATHCSLRLRNKIAAQKAILSSVIVHYELAESE